MLRGPVPAPPPASEARASTGITGHSAGYVLLTREGSASRTSDQCVSLR
jgi:hypothetical protein